MGGEGQVGRVQNHEKNTSNVIYGQPLMVIVLETFRVDVISRAGLALAIKKGFSTTSSSRRN